MSVLPTTSEASTLEFSLYGGLAAPVRAVVAAACFAAFVIITVMAPTYFPLAVFLGIAGHTVIWMKGAKLAPGGATPAHEEVWVPVEDDWLARVRDLEKRGRRWDTSPWDISSGAGFGMLVVLGLLVMPIAFAIGGERGGIQTIKVGLLLLLPLWFNGMRSNWIPSELRKKGED